MWRCAWDKLRSPSCSAARDLVPLLDPISAFLVTIQQSKVAPGPLPLRQVVDRAILITGLTLPRFLHDLPSGTVTAFWLVVLLTCGYLTLDGVLAPTPPTMVLVVCTTFAVALWGVRKHPLPLRLLVPLPRLNSARKGNYRQAIGTSENRVHILLRNRSPTVLSG